MFTCTCLSALSTDDSTAEKPKQKSVQAERNTVIQGQEKKDDGIERGDRRHTMQLGGAMESIRVTVETARWPWPVKTKDERVKAIGGRAGWNARHWPVFSTCIPQPAFLHGASKQYPARKRKATQPCRCRSRLAESRLPHETVGGSILHFPPPPPLLPQTHTRTTRCAQRPLLS